MPSSPRAPDPAFLALQSALVGRFSLESELGRGAMGIVYLARDVLLERPVAIKLLAPTVGAHAEMRARFLREARIAAQCFHPHIVPIHEVAEAGDLAWFVMAYVPGETLAQRLRRAGTLPPEMVRRLGREVGWALAYAHERGVVHRDVKPENILLEQGTDRALIADFGIAWHDPRIADGGSGAQASGEVAGTARYMAPEQMTGAPIDGRADLYALGVTLHLAATGRYPIEGASAMAILASHHAGTSADVRAHAPRLPVPLADAIDRCLATRPEDRFATAATFVASLERTPDGAELPAEAREIRLGVRSTTSLVGWSAAIAFSSAFLVLGEEAASLGRALATSIAEIVVTFAAIVTTLRGAETLVATRRALKSGVSPSVVTDALTAEPEEPVRPLGPLPAGLLFMAGAVLSILQGTVDQLKLPPVPEFFAAIVTVLVPPLLIHRAITQGMPIERRRWWHRFIGIPVAERLVRWLGGGDAPQHAEPAEGATELLLDQNANALLARLPADARIALGALPAATHGLAMEAIRLRERAVLISGEQRRMRAERAGAERLAALEAERQQVDGRLGVTIAALESIRLDLLRLDAAVEATGNLTEHLEVVRELQRRVDAAHEVRRALDAPRRDAAGP